MAKRRNYAKPICHACNRPFDPASPGATQTMGPTCAKRAVFENGSGTDSQLSFGEQLGSQDRPLLSKRFNSRSLKSSLPAHLLEQYHLSKIAFDDLFREFCKNGTLLYGEKALAFDAMLFSDAFETHGFDDPTLDWLEPEHELQLFLARDSSSAFHRRTINGTVSLLHFNASATASAKTYIDVITAFTKALRQHRENLDSTQLSLFSFDL